MDFWLHPGKKCRLCDVCVHACVWCVLYVCTNVSHVGRKDHVEAHNLSVRAHACVCVCIMYMSHILGLTLFLHRI